MGGKSKCSFRGAVVAIIVVVVVGTELVGSIVVVVVGTELVGSIAVVGGGGATVLGSCLSERMRGWCLSERTICGG